MTGTFQHLAADGLFNLTIDHNEPIGVTGNHPIYSLDRKAFIPAESLRPGERVRVRHDQIGLVTSIVPRAGPETVYNLEVHGEHVYHVGSERLLVHNTYELGELTQAQRNNIHGKVFENVAHSRLERTTGNPFFKTKRQGGFDDVTLEGPAVVINEEKFVKSLQMSKFSAITTNLRSNIQEVIDSLPGNTSLTRGEKVHVRRVLQEYLDGQPNDELMIRILYGKKGPSRNMIRRLRQETDLPVYTTHIDELKP